MTPACDVLVLMTPACDVLCKYDVSGAPEHGRFTHSGQVKIAIALQKVQVHSDKNWPTNSHEEQTMRNFN